MADNKFLQTLNIDGTAMDVVFPAGSMQSKKKTGITLAAGTVVKTDPITLNSGYYVVETIATFTAATTTGTTVRTIGYMSPTATGIQTPSTHIDASNAVAYRRTCEVLSVAKGATRELCGAMSSNKASNSGCILEIWVEKVAEMGGVVRTLKNSICYRPRFGKAVA